MKSTLGELLTIALAILAGGTALALIIGALAG
jgi:hypothetical protein